MSSRLRALGLSDGERRRTLLLVLIVPAGAPVDEATKTHHQFFGGAIIATTHAAVAVLPSTKALCPGLSSMGRTGYYANRAEEGNEAVVEALALAI